MSNFWTEAKARNFNTLGQLKKTNAFILHSRHTTNLDNILNKPLVAHWKDSFARPSSLPLNLHRLELISIQPCPSVPACTTIQFTRACILERFGPRTRQWHFLLALTGYHNNMFPNLAGDAHSFPVQNIFLSALVSVETTFLVDKYAYRRHEETTSWSHAHLCERNNPPREYFSSDLAGFAHSSIEKDFLAWLHEQSLT